MTARLTGFLAALPAAFPVHAGVCARAQNLLPNPGFEQGTNTPAGWRLSEGAGNWSDAASDYAPFDVRFTGTGTNQRAQVDFTKFDAAAVRWLDDAGFTAFRLPLRGMGGGTFHSRSLGKLEGFQEGTPEHARLFADYLGHVEQHLRSRGWLGMAYTYWFDEPDRKNYEYFWLLRQAIERVRAKQGESDVLKQARALLTVPAEISTDLTHFTTDPRVMLEHRDRVARMIERLQTPTP